VLPKEQNPDGKCSNLMDKGIEGYRCVLISKCNILSVFDLKLFIKDQRCWLFLCKEG
jgi:hypothetical protein